MDSEIVCDENFDDLNEFDREIKHRIHAGPLPQLLYGLFLNSTRSKKYGKQTFPSGPDLKAVGFPKPRGGHTRRERFKHWAQRMDMKCDPDTKTELLIHKRTGKVIIPIEEFESAIRKVHEKPDGRHNDLKTTINIIQDKYTLGNRDFGMSKVIIRYVVDTCQQCIMEYAVPSLKANCDVNQRILALPNGFLGLESCSMVAHNPDSACIWFDKTVILPSAQFYPRLLSYLNELRGELPGIAKGNMEAKDRFLMKMFIVLEFIRVHQISTQKVLQVAEPFDQSFHNDVKAMFAVYKAEGKEQQFDGDMHLLVNVYRTGGYSEYFIQNLEASICLATRPNSGLTPDQVLYLSNGLALNFREGMDT